MISAQAWVLDLTRTVSRMGRGPMTGIDRVELAYLRYLLGRPEPLFGLVRTALGYVLLGRAGVQGILDRALGQIPIGKADILGLMTQRHLPQHLRAEADARRLAVARCLPVRLGAMLRRKLPPETVFLNVGHANLSAQVMRSAKSLRQGQIVVMVHDTIPLDYPQFCRPEVHPAFADKMAAVAQYADLVVHTAQSTRARSEAHFAPPPPGIVAPLGVELTLPEAKEGLRATPPYFVVLGTIEPRKNLGLLVKVWRALKQAEGAVPHLYIVGNRGWADPPLFAQLEALVAEGDATILPNLSDEAAMALLQGAVALLFPSLAEGYGLPPIEAAALGVPVMAGKLPVVVEMLGDYPVYLDTSDVYAWVDAIIHQLRRRTQQLESEIQIRVPPRWADHFDLVFDKG